MPNIFPVYDILVTDQYALCNLSCFIKQMSGIQGHDVHLLSRLACFAVQNFDGNGYMHRTSDCNYELFHDIVNKPCNYRPID